jgi:hypothetical protein
MSDALKKTYSDYIALGYAVVSGYQADGFHFQVLQGKNDVVIAHMPHAKIMADGFVLDADVQITRFMK